MPSSGALESAPMEWLAALRFCQYICPLAYMNLLLTQWLRPLNVTDVGVNISSSRARRRFLLLMVLSQPLGLLIWERSALMFSPLAFEVYLWAVWEDTHAYLYTHIHVLSKCACLFSLPHVTEPHKARAPLTLCRDIWAFLTCSQQIGAHNSPVLKAASSLLLYPDFRSSACGGLSRLLKEHVANEATAFFFFSPHLILWCRSVVGWTVISEEVLRRTLLQNTFQG